MMTPNPPHGLAENLKMYMQTVLNGKLSIKEIMEEGLKADCCASRKTQLKLTNPIQLLCRPTSLFEKI